MHSENKMTAIYFDNRTLERLIGRISSSLIVPFENSLGIFPAAKMTAYKTIRDTKISMFTYRNSHMDAGASSKKWWMKAAANTAKINEPYITFVPRRL